jgi:hypothetical protein
MGTFNAAGTFYHAALTIAAIVGAPLQPILANEINGKNDRLHRVNMLSTWILGVIAVLPCLVFADLIQRRRRCMRA